MELPKATYTDKQISSGTDAPDLGQDFIVPCPKEEEGSVRLMPHKG